MSDNVIYPPFITKLDIPPERVLVRAIEAELQGVVVMGYDKEGNEYLASSIADGGSVLWLMERVKRELMETANGN